MCHLFRLTQLLLPACVSANAMRLCCGVPPLVVHCASRALLWASPQRSPLTTFTRWLQPWRHWCSNPTSPAQSSCSMCPLQTSQQVAIAWGFKCGFPVAAADQVACTVLVDGMKVGLEGEVGCGAAVPGCVATPASMPSQLPRWHYQQPVR